VRRTCCSALHIASNWMIVAKSAIWNPALRVKYFPSELRGVAAATGTRSKIATTSRAPLKRVAIWWKYFPSSLFRRAAGEGSGVTGWRGSALLWRGGALLADSSKRQHAEWQSRDVADLDLASRAAEIFP
jgi:hypothetical protein